jgi:hypothetical protein
VDSLSLLGVPTGAPLTEWVSTWLKDAQVRNDIYGKIDLDETNPITLADRNERLSSYLAFFATIKLAFQQQGRYAKNDFFTVKPTPEKGASKAWENEKDDSDAFARYWETHIDELREAVQTRISQSQTTINLLKKEMV